MGQKSENNFQNPKGVIQGFCKFLDRGFRPNPDFRDLDFEIFEISRTNWPEINFQNFSIFREIRRFREILDFGSLRTFLGVNGEFLFLGIFDEFRKIGDFRIFEISEILGPEILGSLGPKFSRYFGPAWTRNSQILSGF